MNRRLTLALCLFLGGCGKDSATTTATSPTTTATTFSSLTFTSTVSGSPVAGASVVVAGNRYTTDGAGTITLSPAAGAGATIDASAPGYLSRVTLLRSESTITLWEIPAGQDTSFVRQLAYNRGGTPETLWRPVASSVALRLTGELASDPAVRAAHVQAAAMATSMTGGRVVVSVGDPVAGGVTVTLLVAAAPGPTTTYVSQNGGAIQLARVEYSNTAAARSVTVIAHELGHVLGFGHAPSGLMCPNACGVDSFSSQDQAVFVSMWQRRPGTTALDNDRSLGALSTGFDAVFHCDIR